MRFMTWIVEDLNSASDFLYSIYREVLDWPWPFWYAATFFYSLSRAFNWLAWDFADFADWVDDVADQVADTLGFSDIYLYFRTYFDAALDAWDWVRYAWSNVTGIIDAWWSSTRWTVQGWIDIATQGFDSLAAAWSDFWNITWPQWTSKLDLLAADWSTFWAVTFPTLVSFDWLTTWWNSRVAEVQSLIDSGFTLREPFWAGWQDWRDKVTEFFTDPEDWLYKSFDRIIERFW